MTQEELAKRLWQDNIRECKMLAIYLLPEASYTTIAESWIAEAPFTEIADHLAMNVLCKLPYATEKALESEKLSQAIIDALDAAYDSAEAVAYRSLL